MPETLEKPADNPAEMLKGLDAVLGVTKPVAPPAKKPDDPAPGAKPEVKPEGEKKADDPVVKPVTIPDGFLPAPKKPVEGSPAPEADIPEMPAIPDAEVEKMPPGNKLAIANLRKWGEGLAKQLKELKKNPPTGGNTEEVTALKTQLEQVTTQLERMDLQASPRFNLKYEKPIASIMDRIKKYMADSGVEDTTVADEAAAMPLKERLAMLKENMEDISPVLIPLFEQMDQLKEQRTAELNNAKTTLEQDRALAKQQADQLKDRLFNGAVQTAAKNGHFLLQEVEGNVEWNTNVQAIKKMIYDTFSAEDPNIKIMAMTHGVLAPVYRDMLFRERERANGLEAELAKYRKVMPRVNGDNPVPALEETGKVDKAKPMSAEEASKMVPFKTVE